MAVSVPQYQLDCNHATKIVINQLRLATQAADQSHLLFQFI
jgi:hypothetical protein